MTRIFENGEEILNDVSKKDFDEKVNVLNNFGTENSVQLPQSDKWSDIFGVNTGTSWTDRHNLLRVGQTQTTNYFYGNDSAALFFGGGDTKGGLEIHYQDHEARIVGGNNPKILWFERIAWKSDIQKLEQEISDLKKQIGGVLSRLLTHLNNRLVRKVAV